MYTQNFNNTDYLRKVKIVSESAQKAVQKEFREMLQRAADKEMNAAMSLQSSLRELRKQIFEQTVEIVNSGGYVLRSSKPPVDKPFTKKSLKWVGTPLYEWEIAIDKTEVAANTEFFDAPFSLEECEHEQNTKFSVIEADCLETAQLLVKAGFNPCVLNMASGKTPGGGVVNGSGAQEENLFRRSNLFASLYQFADFAEHYGVTKSKEQYPLDINHGGIYSPNVTVFRSSENTGYALLNAPFQVSVVSVPAINRPKLRDANRQSLAQDFIEPTKEKMRTILRIAGKYQHNALVLSAFGCGAFCNPPKHIATLFKEVFEENEFKNRFAMVVFAIINDRNSHKGHNPDGNFEPFRKIFDN